MDRSLYPEGVEVHQVDLERTEDTRSFHILKRHTDNSLSGIVSGLSVIANSGNGTLIDMNSGYGYVPNGEMVEITTGVTAVALANYTADVENLVTIVYTETNDNLRPHETSNDSLPTAANRNARLRVFTKAQYDLLPYTDDNLDNDARDRTLIISSIVAQGSGVSIPSSAITLPPIYGSAISVSNTTNNITGMTISSAEAGTADGTGTISWNFNNGTLIWVAPGDIAGNPINVLLGGLFNLESTPSNKKLLVFVSSAVLPASDQIDTVELQNLYYSDVPRHSSEDIQHRSFIGSGVPAKNNPHGLTITDLGIVDTPIEEHQILFHSNGIRRDSNINTLLSIVNTSSSPDELNLTVSPDFYVYIRGTLFTSSSQTIISFTDVIDNTQIVFGVYAKNGLNNQVDIEKRERVRFDALTTLTDHLQLRDISKVTIAGVGIIDFDDTADTLQYTAPGDTAGPLKSIPTIITGVRLFSGNGIDYIDVFVSPTLAGSGDVSAPLTITNLPSTTEIKDRIHISTAVYSGSATGFLGNGFGVNNSPNEVLDKRLFGITSPFDIRDDAIPWIVGETTETKSPAAITYKQAGIIDPDYDFDGANINKYSIGTAQIHIRGKAHTLGRSSEQYGLLHQIQYSSVEPGMKQGIRSEFNTDFSSGSMETAVCASSIMNLSHDGGSDIVEAYGKFIEFSVDTDSDILNAVGMQINTPVGNHSIATEITNLYGIRIADQDRGVNNWAVKTGLGLLSFGDSQEFTAGSGIKFKQTPTVGVVDVLQYTNIIRTKDVRSIIDGSTSPNEGSRISLLDSLSPSVSLNDFMVSDVNLANQALLIEICDGNTAIPDGRIIFASTGNDGIVKPFLIFQGDGNIAPGLDDTYDLGSLSSSMANIYSVNVNAVDVIASDNVLVGDINFGLNFTGVDPTINFDSGDFLSYDRTDNRFNFSNSGPIKIPTFIDSEPLITNAIYGDMFMYRTPNSTSSPPGLRLFDGNSGSTSQNYNKIRSVVKTNFTSVETYTASHHFVSSSYVLPLWGMTELSILRVKAYGRITSYTSGSVQIGINIGMSGSILYSAATHAAGVWYLDAYFKAFTMGITASPGNGVNGAFFQVNDAASVKGGTQLTAGDGFYGMLIYTVISTIATVTLDHCEWDLTP